MKLIVVFLHAERVAQTIKALEALGLYHLSVSRTKVIVQPDAPIWMAQLASEGEGEVRLDAYCSDELVEAAVLAVREHSGIGDLPSGALFVHPVLQAGHIHASRSS